MNRRPGLHFRFPGGLLFALAVLAAEAEQTFDGVAKFEAAEAHQAVAVDARWIYAIDSRAIGKYVKATGEKVAHWSAPEASNIQHLNSGIVIDDRLYCAHSNYPGIPMLSSIEIFDTRTLEHVDSHSFGIHAGSATWVDFHDGSWWVAFAHYAKRGGMPGKGPEWTTIIRFDPEWNRREGWVLPEPLVTRLAPYSNSGGGWGPDGYLYLTGHDAARLYRMQLPAAGSYLHWVDELEVPIEGQGIAWDTSASTPVLYGLRRSSNTVVRLELEP